MEPRIQYAKTSDGVSIAYTVFGDGPPLVIPPSLVASHLQMEWEMPGRRQMYERFAERATIVRFDPRGVGMSQGEVPDLSLKAWVRDLESVLLSVSLEHFALYVRPSTGDLPLEYAAQHPERISHLVLIGRLIGPRWRPIRSLLPLVEDEWELFANVYARLLAGWDSPDATPMAALIRASHSPQTFRPRYELFESRDPLALAPRLHVPTLILHSLGDDLMATGARSLAAAIDGAFRTILFTDIVAHTAMMERLGDDAGRNVLREHERITREALREHGGSEIKTIGDSFMASFSSAQKALECAIALQRAFASTEVCGERVRIRAGINAGEPITEGDDLFGASVILAARAKESAGEGEIVVTDVVRQLVTGKGFPFAERGEVALRGFEDPVRLYEVRWREDDA